MVEALIALVIPIMASTLALVLPIGKLMRMSNPYQPYQAVVTPQSLQLAVIDGNPYQLWTYRCEIKTMTYKTIRTTYGLQRMA